MSMRLIDADKVKELIRGPLSVDRDTDKEYVCGLIDKIESGWISVKDRLPEKSAQYLIYQSWAASICAFNVVRWSSEKGWMGHEVGSRIEGITYWMPLPEPPEVSK